MFPRLCSLTLPVRRPLSSLCVCYEKKRSRDEVEVEETDDIHGSADKIRNIYFPTASLFYKNDHAPNQLLNSKAMLREKQM